MFGTKKHLLVAIAISGWLVASFFFVLSCLAVSDRYGEEVVIIAVILGASAAVVPTSCVLLLAYAQPWASPDPPTKLLDDAWAFTSQKLEPWSLRRKITFLALCAGQVIGLPITLLLIASDDDFLGLLLLHGVAATLTIVAAGIPRSSSYRRIASAWLIALQMIGIAMAVIASAVEIETIVATGPILLCTGIAVACIGVRPADARAAFGLSTPLMFFVVVFVIIFMEWGPSDSTVPVFAMLLAYEAAIAPIGLVALHRVLSHEQKPRKWQFGIRELLATMLAISIALACGRLAASLGSGHQNEEVRASIATVVGVLICLSLAGVVVYARRSRWVKRIGSPKRLYNAEQP